jgi:ATP-dependent DNA ligase
MMNLSQVVADTAASAVNESLGGWLASHPNPFCEIKYDGRRVFLFKMQDKILLATKHNGLYTAGNYPALFANMPKLNCDKAILDCELQPQTQELRVFDVLTWDDSRIMDLPQMQRRGLLIREIPETLRFRVSEGKHLGTMQEIKEYKKDVIERGFEGLMLKDGSAKYGKPGSWLKVKKFDTLDCFVTGKVPGKDGYDFFIASYNKEGQRVDLGKCGSFVKSVNPGDIKIGTVIEVQYQEFSVKDKLRHPFCIKIRDDKRPEDCRFERELETQ